MLMGCAEGRSRRGGRFAVGVVLNIFEQALLLSSLVVFTAFILWHTTRAPSRQELALRVMALFAGAMVIVGARAVWGAGGA